MPDWKGLYFLFSDLWARYSAVACNNPRIGQQIVRQALNPTRSFAQVAGDIGSFGLSIDLASDWRSIEALRDAYDDMYVNSGLTSKAPALSVYQTAIQIKLTQFEDQVDGEGERRWFYRGQRNSIWTADPKIFRELGKKPEDEYQARLNRVRTAVRAIQDNGIAADELQALAIAQHYSEPMKLRTWLLDVTTSPYVALFFASDGGEEGQIGVLDCIEREEWMLFSEGATDAVGAIRYVSPQGIPRIQNQSGFFIEAPHPELYRQMSHRRFYFRQEKGVVFEDDTAVPPILRTTIYPPDDPILAQLPEVPAGMNSAPLAWEPSLQCLTHPDETVFFSIASPWLKGISSVQKDTIWSICRLHAAITSQGNGLPHYIGTLHHLLRVTDMVLDDELSDVREWFESMYTSHIETRDAGDILLKCVAQACPRWEPIAIELLNSQ